MTTMGAVGRSQRLESRVAGRDAAEQAAAALQGPAGLVLVFGTTGYDQIELLRGIADVFGEAPISGCSSRNLSISPPPSVPSGLSDFCGPDTGLASPRWSNQPVKEYSFIVPVRSSREYGGGRLSSCSMVLSSWDPVARISRSRNSLIRSGRGICSSSWTSPVAGPGSSEYQTQAPKPLNQGPDQRPAGCSQRQSDCHTHPDEKQFYSPSADQCRGWVAAILHKTHRLSAPIHFQHKKRISFLFQID